MAIGDDFEIQNDGDIRHVSGSATYAVLELHRWLQDRADDPAASSDDFLDITKTTPSERSTDNIITLNAPFNIDDTAAQYLYNGSITQNSGNTVYVGLVVVGATEASTQLQITQDNAVLTSYWSTGLNADSSASILLRIMVKVRVNGADIDGKRFRVWARELSDKYAEFSVAAGLGNNTAAIFTSNDLNNQTASGTIAGWTITNTEGLRLIDVDIDTVNEEYYSEWDPGAQSINDLYEYTKYLQRRGTAATVYGMNGALFRGVSHSFAYDGEGSGPFSQNEVLVWGTSFAYDGQTVNLTVGEYLSFSPSGAKAKLLQMTDGGATGSLVIAKEVGSGTIADNDVITGLTSGGNATVNGAITGQSVVGGEAAILALDDDGATGNLYVQLLSGVAPVDNDPIRGRTSGATALVNGSITTRTISPEFVGASTGSALIGAYGVGVKATELSASDLVFDLSNSSITPPNYATFTVSGVVSGEDYVMVGPQGYSFAYDTEASGPFVVGEVLTFPAGTATLAELIDQGAFGVMVIGPVTGTVPVDNSSISGGTSGATASVNGSVGVEIDSRQMTLNGLLNGAAVVAVVVNGAIPSDTPSPTGTIRILRSNGARTKHAYTSWTGSTFTIGATDFSSNTAANGAGVFVSYIDVLADDVTEAFTSVYSADRALAVKVRDGGGTPIKPFVTTGTLSSTGGSVTAIRTTDA